MLVEVVADELERGQSQRALDDLVVQRDEADLGAEIARICEELLVRVNESDVEDLAESVRHLLPGALDVGGDPRRRGDDLILVARVELHVPRFVDLLGGQERDLLLT